MTWYNYTYTYTCGNIINNNDEQTHFFRKIYLSHFFLERVVKGFMMVICERWVGDGERLPHIDPKFLCIIAALLPHSAGLLNRGPEGPSPLSGAGSHCGILSPTATVTRTVTATRTPTLPASNSNSTQTVCGTWLYNCLTPTCFPWASHLHRIQPVHRSRWYSDIFDRIHLFLDWRLGRRSICHNLASYIDCPISWGCRIYRLLLCSNECPGYDT